MACAAAEDRNLYRLFRAAGRPLRPFRAVWYFQNEMPIYIEISRLYRCVTFVARDRITREEILTAAEALLAANVPDFAKLVDVTGATAGVTAGDIRHLAAVLHRRGKIKRGPVAFLIDPARSDFARAFAATQRDRPVRLFTSIHQARDWLAHSPKDEASPQRASPVDGVMAWSDPEREAVMVRRRQRRTLPMPASRYATL